ncbi:hypothetical protein J1614_001384 [Plenodomus biglobosus]|nr:hypothetical protein J1614_001384 [Plenodomus biglobosus]
MDDHHQQPIWPMMQGILDYALNIAGEVWIMIWKPKPEQRALPVNAMAEQSAKRELHMVQTAMHTGAASIHDIVGNDSRINRGA